MSLQVLLLDRIGVYYNLSNPYLYVLVIIMLPLDVPVFWLYAIAFTTGLVIDTFSNSLGIHAVACVLMAYVRIVTLNLMNPRGTDFYAEPTLGNMGFNRFITYSAILVFFHHLALISLDIFRVSEFFYIILRVLSSAVFTLILIMLTEYLFYGRRTKA